MGITAGGAGLADSSVTTIKLGINAVTGPNISDSTITTGKMQMNTITDFSMSSHTTTKITTPTTLLSGTITNAQIGDSTVSTGKMQQSSVSSTQLNFPALKRLYDSTLTAVVGSVTIGGLNAALERPYTLRVTGSMDSAAVSLLVGVNGPLGSIIDTVRLEGSSTATTVTYNVAQGYMIIVEPLFEGGSFISVIEMDSGNASSLSAVSITGGKNIVNIGAHNYDGLTSALTALVIFPSGGSMRAGTRITLWGETR